MAKDKNRDHLRAHGIRILTVAGIEVRTNLTEADLQNPRLWTMRTPEAWAQAISSGNDAPSGRFA